MSPHPRRILVPLDGSRLAESVLPLARDLSVRWPAELLLLHLVERRPPATVHGQPHLTTGRDARRYLEGLAGELREAGARVDAHVHEPPEANVVQGLVDHAQEADADVILLCTHGRGGLRDLVVGSIAQQTLARASRPVLLVHPPAAELPRPGPSRWVVPVEPTSHDVRDVPILGRLARALGARLHLVSVVPTIEALTAERRAAATLSPAATVSLLDMEASDTQDALEGLASWLRDEGVEADLEIRRGDAVDEVARLMASGDWRLLVVTTHARSGLQGRLERSFAVRIVGRVRQPVLLLPLRGT